MKTISKIIGIIACLLVIGCGNDDDNTPAENEETVAMIVGEWERTSGTLLGFEADYLIFNDNNTLNYLTEDSLGFREKGSGNYTSNETQVTIDILFFGNNLVNFTITENTLQLQDSSGNLSSYNRATNAPAPGEWIETINPISQGVAPWDEDADIAYNGTHILLGNGNETDAIGLINPETFNLDDMIPTTRSVYAVEVEKFDVPDKYIFQSSNGSSKFAAYFENTNTQDFESIDLGAWISGLASVDQFKIWATSGNEQSLYLLNYTNPGAQIIERTIPLDRGLEGLDYQDGILYMCARGYIYKCDVSTSFEIIDTYQLEDYRAVGIAFDGTNFWVNASSNDGSPNQLIKTSLTL